MKNEGERIVRAADSLRPHLAGIIMMDTGSTDGSPEILQEWANLHQMPCIIGRTKFRDFAQSRNEALALARQQTLIDYDYLLLSDLDMELVVNDPHWTDGLLGESYDMFQCAGMLHYQNRRLLSKFSHAIYFTPTHEFLNAASAGLIPRIAAHFKDHADGANRPEKFKRDIKILKAALKRGDQPLDRIYYYLAQSYRDAGDYVKAAQFYKKRIDLGGWDEEVWSAMGCLAACYLAMGDEEKWLRQCLLTYDFRPSRAETLHDLAKHFRDKGRNNLSLLFSEPGMKIPMTGDALFVNDYIYQQGLKDEFSICAFYVAGRYDDGFRVCDALALTRSPYDFSSRLADANLLHYMLPLGANCPSLKLQQIEFAAEEHWIAMNPSVCLHRGELKALVRTVNYRMDEHGRYLIRATDGTANATNPINTRNWLVPLDRTLGSIAQIELVPREPIACEYPLVVGFEDARIFDCGDNLYISATVRQRCADGLAEQTLARIGSPCGEPAGPWGGQSQLGLDDVRPMLRSPRHYEKNWMPVAPGDSIRFMYRPGHLVDAFGQDISIHPTKLRSDSFSGSSQLIEFYDGWLGVIHEAHYFIDRPYMRYYTHRFVFYDHEFKLDQVSRPFFFKEKVIEFVAGLSWHPNHTDLIISFGFKDCEAWLARISASEVWEFLCRLGQKEPK